MRNIEYLVLHTTAGNQDWSPEQVQHYFLRVKKWRVGGYHWLIDKAGIPQRLYDDQTVTNGVLPFVNGTIHISNANAIHISWIGGIGKDGTGVDNRTPGQIQALEKLVLAYLQTYPHIRVLGHNQVARKLCPCFDVPLFCRMMGVPPSNIYAGDHFSILKELAAKPLLHA
jgi:hypothetical protein